MWDVVETNNHVNIIMEYLSGISLNSYLKLQPNNKALIVIDMNMDTSTATGKLVLTMLAGVAEFEKSQINERTKNGKKARAKTSDYANGGQPKFGHKA
ncbi:MAG: recombinase family protein, partial [bacterium]